MSRHCAVPLNPAQALPTFPQQPAKSFPCHTSKISPVTPFFATHPEALFITPLLTTLTRPPSPFSHFGTKHPTRPGFWTPVESAGLPMPEMRVPTGSGATPLPATAASLRFFSVPSVNPNSVTSVLKTHVQIAPGSGRLARGLVHGSRTSRRGANSSFNFSTFNLFLLSSTDSKLSPPSKRSYSQSPITSHQSPLAILTLP